MSKQWQEMSEVENKACKILGWNNNSFKIKDEICFSLINKQDFVTLPLKL